MTAPGALEIRLLGRFVVLRDGREVPAADFGGRKVRALVRMLATRRGESVSHDALTEMLWGDRPPADPVANLQVLVNRARRALGRPELLVTGPGAYSLAAGTVFVVDADRFLSAIAAARDRGGRDGLAAYQAAFADWRGDPLAEDVYSSWAAGYRDRLTRARQQALEDAAELALALGQPATAVELASTAASAEPLREVAVLTLVRALAAAGDRVAALDRYEQYRRVLAEDLGLDPSENAASVQADLLRRRASGFGGAPTRQQRPDFAVLPFVGRAVELEVLRSTLARGATVLLSGGSGTGKSRLLAELAHQQPLLLVRAFLAERDEPWSLIRSLLREVLAADATAAEQLPASTLSALVWLLPELESPAARGSAVLPDPESRRSLLVEAAGRLLVGSRATLVVDDLQWADASSLSLVQAALSRAETAAVFAFRPEEIDRDAVSDFLARVRPAATRVELRPFEATEIDELSADAALTGVLAASTDRTPLAVTEVFRTLITHGVVAPAPDRRWRVLSQAGLVRAEEVAIDGQRAAILARVAAQEPIARELTHLLALVAREIPARVLSIASDTAERIVLDTLGVLSRRGLARLGDQGWATAHDMVGDVVVDSLPRDERGRLHASLAAALEAVATDAGELARHWLGAADMQRAADSYLKASADALAAFADREAAALATAGLDISPPPDLAAALCEVRAQARSRLGDIGGARDDLRRAMAVHPGGPVRARLLGRLALLASGADDLVRAAELAELALVDAGADPAARAHALEIAAVLDMNLDQPARAEVRASDALALYQQIGDANGTARILDGRAMATFLDGRIEEGITLLDRAANLFEDSGDLVRVVTPRSTAGHGLVFAAEPERGLAKTRAALELATALGHPEGQTYALWHTTEALAALHRADEALMCGLEALEIAERLGHRGWTATAWRAVGIAHQERGDPESALTAFGNSLEVSAHLNLFASWAAARCALVLIELGDLAGAELLVDRALTDGPPLGHYEARSAQVELAAARGDPRTSTLASRALQLADAGGMRLGRERLALHAASTA